MSTHFEKGKAVMVDVTDKRATHRQAVAEALLELPEAAFAGLVDNPKGDALAVAELAGIMAAKRTSELIPLCHPLPLTRVTVRGDVLEKTRQVRFEALCKTTAQTGVEMEALTAVSVAALTLYDMLKGQSKGVVIRQIRLLSKEGGKSGPWQAEPTQGR